MNLSVKTNMGLGRFRMFTDDELDIMESLFGNEAPLYLVSEVRLEKRFREKENKVYADSNWKDKENEDGTT